MFRLRKLAIGALCLVLVFVAFIQPAEATIQLASDGSQFSYTTLVHNWASTGSAVIGQMEDGSCVTVLGEYGDFYKVDCFETTGYIVKSQVSLKEDGNYYIACNPSSSQTKKMAHTSLADAVSLRADVLGIARRQLGSAYVYGASTPGAFDCSGLSSYVYRNAGRSIHREADSQMQDGLIIAKENLQVGDLVFFRASGSPWLASHVGIYAGDGMFIHSSTSKGVIYSSLSQSYYYGTYVGARRIFNTGTSELRAVLTVTTPSAMTHTPGMGIRSAG